MNMNFANWLLLDVATALFVLIRVDS